MRSRALLLAVSIAATDAYADTVLGTAAGFAGRLHGYQCGRHNDRWESWCLASRCGDWHSDHHDRPHAFIKAGQFRSKLRAIERPNSTVWQACDVAQVLTGHRTR